VKRLRLMDIAGATVYRGILGYGAKGHRHKGGSFFSHDLPVMVSVVDTEDRAAIDAVEGLMQDGLIVLFDVEVIRLVGSRPAEEMSNANR
jgi:PII-like signaling protein